MQRKSRSSRGSTDLRHAGSSAAIGEPPSPPPFLLLASVLVLIATAGGLEFTILRYLNRQELSDSDPTWLTAAVNKDPAP